VTYPNEGNNGYDQLLGIVQVAVADIPEFYVLGSSFSGPLAIMLAAAEPDRVRGIIMSATFLRPPRWKFVPFKFAVIGPVIWVLRLVGRFSLWTFKRPDDSYRQAKAETWSKVSAAALAARLRAILDIDVRAIARVCHQPVLSIVFEQDTVVPRTSSDEILQTCPSAKEVMLPGNHFAMFSDPVVFAAKALSFIQEAESVLNK
jgi:pimeloyl-ACP methyl ester carboxylesterase